MPPVVQGLFLAHAEFGGRIVGDAPSPERAGESRWSSDQESSVSSRAGNGSLGPPHRSLNVILGIWMDPWGTVGASEAMIGFGISDDTSRFGIPF